MTDSICEDCGLPFVICQAKGTVEWALRYRDKAEVAEHILPLLPAASHDTLEARLLALLRGKHSSLSISFNDDHACMFETAEEHRKRTGFYCGGDGDVLDWVSPDERERAVAQNSVWTLQWYPDTPSGFQRIGASSLTVLLQWLEANPDGEIKETDK